MDIQQTLPSPSVQSQILPELVGPPQVWIHLSQTQQQHVLQAIVLVCQEFLRWPHPTPAQEAPHE
jgi:hypothetical protein